MIYLPGVIGPSGVVHVAQEDQAVARLEFGGNGFFVVGDTLVVPGVGPGDHDRGAVLFRRFRHSRHAADHHRLFSAVGVVVLAEKISSGFPSARRFACVTACLCAALVGSRQGFTLNATVEEMIGRSAGRCVECGLSSIRMVDDANAFAISINMGLVPYSTNASRYSEQSDGPLRCFGEEAGCVRHVRVEVRLQILSNTGG